MGIKYTFLIAVFLASIPVSSQGRTWEKVEGTDLAVDIDSVRVEEGIVTYAELYDYKVFFPCQFVSKGIAVWERCSLEIAIKKLNCKTLKGSVVNSRLFTEAGKSEEGLHKGTDRTDESAPRKVVNDKH
ncbi:MAG: hypothetical protein WBM97_17620, partial [Sedimenticolaceae bacterium]